MSNNQITPLELINLVRQGQNPQQLVIAFLQQNSANNPIYQNLINLVNKGDTAAIEQIVRNMARERGIDYDSAFGNFKRNLGLK